MVQQRVQVFVNSGFNIAGAYLAAGRRMHGAMADRVGLLHAKVFWAGETCIVGSVNWTTSSRCNRELAVELQLDARGVANLQALWDINMMAGAHPFQNMEHIMLTGPGYG
jgi:phosphatidylserine/phosphatidylglycerophosphate/cardiolipin synthase-like enzyme